MGNFGPIFRLIIIAIIRHITYRIKPITDGNNRWSSNNTFFSNFITQCFHYYEYDDGRWSLIKQLSSVQIPWHGRPNFNSVKTMTTVEFLMSVILFCCVTRQNRSVFNVLILLRYKTEIRTSQGNGISIIRWRSW